MSLISRPRPSLCLTRVPDLDLYLAARHQCGAAWCRDAGHSARCASLAGFDPLATGLIVSDYFIGYIVGTYQCARLIRHFRHIRVYAAMVALGSASALLYGLIVNVFVCAGLRVMTGICMVGVYIVIESWLNEQSLQHLRGKVFAVYMSVTLLAMAARQFLMLTADVQALHLLALASMLFSLGLVPITLTRVREPESVPHAVESQAPVCHRAGGLGQRAADLWDVRQRADRDGNGTRSAPGCPTAGTVLFMSVTIAGGALLQWLIGHLSNARDRRNVLALVRFTAAASALAIFAALDYWSPAAYAISFVYGGLLFPIYALSAAYMNDHLQREDILEATEGLLLVYGAGPAMRPAFVGLFMDVFKPGTFLFFFAGMLALLGYYAAYLIRRRTELPSRRRSRLCP